MADDRQGAIGSLNAGKFADDYDVGEMLGEGTFAKVYDCTHKKTGEKRAVKIISKETDYDSEQLEKETMSEIRILTKLNHPHIVNLYEWYDTETDYYVVLEFINGGELFDRIVELQKYSEQSAADLIKQVLAALSHMHTQDVIHRDLKPENLLLSSKEPDATIRLADFGLATEVPRGELIKIAVGTPGYIAPETLLAVEGGEGYSKPCDIWGVGVILYILLCGFQPFFGDDDEEIFEQILQNKFDFPSPYWDSVSDEAKDFVTRMLAAKPEDRPTALDAMEHEWIKSASSEELATAQSELKRFMARRRLKKAVNAVRMINKMKNLKLFG